jgi:hypothetical protein
MCDSATAIKQWLDHHDSALQGLREALIKDLIAIVASYALVVQHGLPSSFSGQTYSTPGQCFSSGVTYRHVFSRFTLAACRKWCVRFHAGSIPAFSTGFANKAADISQQMVARSWGVGSGESMGSGEGEYTVGLDDSLDFSVGLDDSLDFSKSRSFIEIPIVPNLYESSFLTRGAIRCHSHDGLYWHEQGGTRLCDEYGEEFKLLTRDGQLESDLYVAVHADTETRTLRWTWFDLSETISSVKQLNIKPNPLAENETENVRRARIFESRGICWSPRLGALLDPAALRPFIDLGHGSSASFEAIPLAALSQLDPVFHNSD